MSTHTFEVDDRVVIDPTVANARERGVVYRVTRLLTTNVEIEPQTGGRPMRVNPQHLQAAPDGADAVAALGVARQAPLVQGTIVTVAGPTWKQPPEQLFVVLRDNGDARASIVKLGGDAGRYWRGVSRHIITVVDPHRIRVTPEQAG